MYGYALAPFLRKYQVELLGAVIRVWVAPYVAALVPKIVRSLIVETKLVTRHDVLHEIVHELLLRTELLQVRDWTPESVLRPQVSDVQPFVPASQGLSADVGTELPVE